MFLPSRVTIFFSFFLIVLLFTGCKTAEFHKAAVTDDSSDRMTVGKVQREIRVGMSGAEVARVLGSPNIVSTDEERREVWIYDKIATDNVQSSTSGGATILILGVNSSTGASSTSQRTLTVIIKFDNVGKVRDFAYHTTRF
jgi:outer membrane protein assembly factor BamE (lipoprotein component of BamABCDE complex)